MAESPLDVQSHTPTREDLLSQLRGGAGVEVRADRKEPPPEEEIRKRDIAHQIARAEFYARYHARTVELEAEKADEEKAATSNVIALDSRRQAKLGRLASQPPQRRNQGS